MQCRCNSPLLWWSVGIVWCLVISLANIYDAVPPLAALALADHTLQKTSLIHCNTWPKYRQGHNLIFSTGAFTCSVCPISTHQRSAAQDSGVGGVQCILPAICGTSCALSLPGFYTRVLLMPLLKNERENLIVPCLFTGVQMNFVFYVSQYGSSRVVWTLILAVMDFCPEDFVQIKATYFSPSRLCWITAADGEKKIWIFLLSRNHKS